MEIRPDHRGSELHSWSHHHQGLLVWSSAQSARGEPWVTPESRVCTGSLLLTLTVLTQQP